MDTGFIVHSAIDLAAGCGALALLAFMARRVFGTPLWNPLLLLYTGVAVFAFVDWRADLAADQGDPTLHAELLVAANSGLLIAIAGLIGLSAVYPRRLEGAWVGPALFAVYAVAITAVVLAPASLRFDPAAAPGNQVQVAGDPFFTALSYPLVAGLACVLGWDVYLALRGRNGKERKAGRILALSIGLPVSLALVIPLAGLAVTATQQTSFFVILWLIGTSSVITTGALPMPAPMTLRRVIDSSAAGILLLDADTTIVTANQAATRLLGLEGPVAGRPFESALAGAFHDPEEWSEASRLVGGSLRSGASATGARATAVGPRRTPVRVIVDPLRQGGAQGGAQGAVVRFVDETVHRQAEESAQKARDMQDLVIRVLGHDLKAPLSVIAGFIDLVDGRLQSPLSDGDRSAARAYLKKVKEASSLMQVIMANARAISRVTLGGAPEPGRAAVDLAKMVSEMADVLRPLAEAKRITMQVEAPAELRLSLPPGFESVIGNLVSNAIKYTPEGGRVDLRASTAGGTVRLEVEDTGPGVPAEARPRLFKKFERLAKEQSVGSHGLGLSIASSIVGLAGGTLTAHDRPDGRSGSLFRVELPLAATREAAAPR